MTVEPAPLNEVQTSAAGVVTDVAVAAGDVVAGGDVLIEVEDSAVVAFTGSAPLYRDLDPGMVGPDVARLQLFLEDEGLLDARTSKGTVDQPTADAITAFNQRFGLGSAQTLRLATVAWIGTADAELADIAASVGAVVAPGTPIMSRSSGPPTVTVEEPPEGLPSDDGAGSVLRIDEVSVPYELGSGVVAGDDAALLAAALPEGDGVGWIEPASTRTVKTIPASAVVTDSDGALCVYPDVDERAVPVTPIGGGVGTVDLPAETEISTVLVNPGDVVDEPACA